MSQVSLLSHPAFFLLIFCEQRGTFYYNTYTTGRFKKKAKVSNDEIWFSFYLGLRVSDLQQMCVYPP
jgi:hypothetical protein